MRVLPDIAFANPLDDPMPALLDLDRLQMVRIEPLLQPIDVAIGGGLVAPSVLVGEIVVEPVRGSSRLTHDHRGDGDQDDDQRTCERDVHDGDGDPAPDSKDPESPDDRVEPKRDQGRYTEEGHG